MCVSFLSCEISQQLSFFNCGLGAKFNNQLTKIGTYLGIYHQCACMQPTMNLVAAVKIIKNAKTCQGFTIRWNDLSGLPVLKEAVVRNMECSTYQIFLSRNYSFNYAREI